jgi:selenide,water dikinase
VLRQLPVFTDPNLLVGVETADDAAIFRMSDDVALVLTVDFFPPIVDDPYTYGEVAAANALSDVYSKGGRPILALNIVGFPVGLPKEILGEILKGGAAKAKEAGTLIVGGHTVDDKEPKYGMAVTGVVVPGQHVTNAGAKVGDMLVLTKPIGTGIITTAGKQQRVKPEVLQNAVKIMSTLNRAASEAMMKVGVNACVDVTGFGLLGHLRPMIEASNVSAQVRFNSVPVIEGVSELLEQGIAPGGTRRNLNSLNKITRWHPDIDEMTRLLLSDAQTSGGLLISVAANKRDQLLEELEAAGVETRAVIGEIVSRDALGGKRIEVLP